MQVIYYKKILLNTTFYIFTYFVGLVVEITTLQKHVKLENTCNDRSNAKYSKRMHMLVSRWF